MFNGRLGTFRWWRSLRSPITGCGDVPPRGGYQRRGEYLMGTMSRLSSQAYRGIAIIRGSRLV